MGYASPLAFFFSSVALFLASFPGLVPIGIAEPDFYDPRRVIQISWRPRIFLYKGFLSDEECDHIVKLVERSSCPCLFMALKFACTSAHFHVKFEQARSKMARSMVADNGSGNSVKSNVRTSSGMFLQKHQCHKNPLYMIGNNGTTGNCRRSCNAIQASIDGSVAPLISLCATAAET
ncbi:hypothetical protein BHM03_00026824 [Ensete ventricosum]|nr:hypothetical protein BHM03_00026824 [Ensete ventricosum]